LIDMVEGPRHANMKELRASTRIDTLEVLDGDLLRRELRLTLAFPSTACCA
jgi:hypothetical protein